jgi:hypothetical protein
MDRIHGRTVGRFTGAAGNGRENPRSGCRDSGLLLRPYTRVQRWCVVCTCYVRTECVHASFVLAYFSTIFLISLFLSSFLKPRFSLPFFLLFFSSYLFSYFLSSIHLLFPIIDCINSNSFSQVTYAGSQLWRKIYGE